MFRFLYTGELETSHVNVGVMRQVQFYVHSCGSFMYTFVLRRYVHSCTKVEFYVLHSY